MLLHSQILGQSSQLNDLFILHGLYGSSSNWRSLGMQYANARRVHLIDLRNHGQSPWHHEHDYIALASDIQRYADYHGIAHFDLIGHSMGGKTAMSTALQFPQYLGRLIIADIAPVPYIDNEHNGYIEAMRKTIEANPASRKEADEILSKYIKSMPIRQFFLQNFILEENENGIAVARWRIHLDALHQNLENILDFPRDKFSNRVYEQPALFIHGGKSDYVQSHHHDEIYTLFPAAKIQRIEHASHWLHAEAPEEFYQITQKFLQT